MTLGMNPFSAARLTFGSLETSLKAPARVFMSAMTLRPLRWCRRWRGTSGACGWWRRLGRSGRRSWSSAEPTHRSPGRRAVIRSTSHGSCSRSGGTVPTGRRSSRRSGRCAVHGDQQLVGIDQPAESSATSSPAAFRRRCQLGRFVDRAAVHGTGRHRSAGSLRVAAAAGVLQSDGVAVLRVAPLAGALAGGLTAMKTSPSGCGRNVEFDRAALGQLDAVGDPQLSDGGVVLGDKGSSWPTLRPRASGPWPGRVR